MARLFFALWPDAAATRRLAQLAEALAPLAAGKPVAAESIHLTLAFLGELPPGRVEEALATRIEAAPFELALDRVGAFRGAKVAWAGMGEPPPALADLQSRLAADLRRRGFDLEARPFAPHVTLVRKVAKRVPATPVAPIAWRVEAVALVRTQPRTGRYETAREWTLGT